MADVTKIDVVSMLEPNGEPENTENLARISKLFYGTKNGDLISPLDSEVVASLETILNAYGVIPVIANVLANGTGGVSYDIVFTGKAASFISNSTSSAVTVTDPELTVLQDMDTLLDKIETYKTLSLAGAFTYTDSTYGDMYLPATLRYVDVVANAAVKVLMPSLDIGDKDAILLDINCANNSTAYVGSFVVYEDENGTVKTLNVTQS